MSAPSFIQRKILNLKTATDPYSVVLGDYFFDNTNSKEIQEYAACLKERLVDRLDLSKTDFSKNFDRIKYIFQAIDQKSNGTLQSLALTDAHLEKLGTAELDFLYEWIKTVGVKRVNIGHNKVSDSQPLINFIVKLANTVESLDLYNCEIGHCTPENQARILEALKKGSDSTLRTLNYSDNWYWFREEDLGKIMAHKAIIFTLIGSNLEYLFLHGSFRFFEHEDWDKFFTILEGNKSLKYLNINGCELGHWVPRSALSPSEMNLLEFSDDFDPNLSYSSEELTYGVRIPSQQLISRFTLFLEKTHLEDIDFSYNDFPKEVTKKLIAAAVSNPNLVKEFGPTRADANGISRVDIKAFIAELKETKRASIEQGRKEQEQAKPVRKEEERKEDSDSQRAKPVILSGGPSASHSIRTPNNKPPGRLTPTNQKKI